MFFFFVWLNESFYRHLCSKEILSDIAAVLFQMYTGHAQATIFIHVKENP